MFFELVESEANGKDVGWLVFGPMPISCGDERAVGQNLDAGIERIIDTLTNIRPENITENGRKTAAMKPPWKPTGLCKRIVGDC